jgi:glycosyltransferase 2 family protein
LKRIAKIVISAALFVFAVYLLDVGAMFQAIQQVSIGTFLIAIAINILTFAIMGHRWYVLTSNAIQSSYSYQMAVYYKATFLNTFTPANLGGDAYRLIALKNNRITANELLKFLFYERIIGLYGYVITFFVSYLLVVIWFQVDIFAADNPFSYAVLLSVVLFSFPFVAKKIGKIATPVIRFMIGESHLLKIKSWIHMLLNLFFTKGRLLPVFLTFVGIATWVISIELVANSMGLILPILQLTLVAVLVELVRLVPITVQGIGLREFSFAYLLSTFGYNIDLSYAVALTSYAALSLSILLCGPIGWLLELVKKGAEK